MWLNNWERSLRHYDKRCNDPLDELHLIVDSAPVETPREHPALAAADVLAHQYIFTSFHEKYWLARGGHDACTVCNPPPSEKTSGESP
jgi:hypothetical protein